MTVGISSETLNGVILGLLEPFLQEKHLRNDTKAKVAI